MIPRGVEAVDRAHLPGKRRGRGLEHGPKKSLALFFDETMLKVLIWRDFFSIRRNRLIEKKSRKVKALSMF